MGEVWRARNEATGADVALKVLRGDADEVTGARLRSEARLGATLAHRNIVRIFDLLEEPDGTLILVMELLRGESLAHWLERRGTLRLKEAVAVAVAVLSGLAHAHDSGVIHRDVTPANIFLTIDPDGYVTPKLVDFGIAKIPGVGSQTLPGSVLGTPRYMSPEQIRSAEELDGRSDLFSVAAVLYEMLTGASPFEAKTPAASLALVLESSVDPDPLIEPRVWVELSRALAKRPYARHAGAKEMAGALCSAVSETDASLAALLRRDPPARVDADAGEGDEQKSQKITTVEGQSLDAGRRAFPRSGWLVGLAGAACLAIVIGAAIRPPAKAANAPAAAGGLPSGSVATAQTADTPVTSSQAIPVAQPSATAAEPPPSPAAPISPSKARVVAPPRSTSTPARPAVRPPTAPTAIATTPGF
jgi:serine/threonine-protein kinase